MRTFTASVPVWKHDNLELVTVRTCVEGRTVKLNSGLVLCLCEFLPEIVYFPVELAVGERFAVFHNFTELVDLFSLINSEL